MHSLWQQVIETREALETAEQDARESGSDLANAEARYQVAKHTCVAKMKAEKVPATLIQLTVKGDHTVNRAMLQRDLAQVAYKSDMEHINVLKKEIDLLREQMQREWSSR